MRRCIILLLLVLLAMTLSAGAAFAADPVDVADQVDPRGYYIEPGAGVDFGVMEDLVARLANLQTRFYFVALADNPDEGTDEFAEKVLTLLDQGATVVVISPDEIGARSDDFSDSELNQAADEAVGDADRSFESDFRVFAESLIGVPAGATATTTALTTTSINSAAGGSSASGRGSGGIYIFMAFVVGLIAVVYFMTRRSAKQAQQSTVRRLDEAKQEIREQLDVIANEILDLADKVTLSEQDEAEEYFRTASATYQQAQDQLDKATNLAELERLSDDLDTTRWQLEAAEAVVEGRPIPPEPEDRPNSCFFDPTHRAGVEEAKIETAAGSKTVSVCRECAEKLRRGEQPKPRDIMVGGRRVPAPMAPRSHGGGGFDWMGVVAVILSGLAQGSSYDFGRRPRRPSGLGGLIFPSSSGSRSSSSRSSMGSASSSRSVPRSSRPSSRGMGRTRRKR
ncbi:MAG: YhcB family protein [Acidimicrobiia bacterium]|nr:YhcB family protein [Acidimicrobiia bacterium]